MNTFGATKRLLVVAALLYLSIGSLNAFDTSKEYIYDYQGAVTTKVADKEKPQYSGLSIKTQIKVLKYGANFIVQLNDPQMATFNDVIEEIHLYNYDYKPMVNATGIDKPFYIYLNGDGSAYGVDAIHDEPKWVTNFKKGLISFFQIQFPYQTDSKYYVLNEKSVMGECDTDYIVNEANGMINVTKTRNTAKCNSRYMHRFIPVPLRDCLECDKDVEEFKHSNAVFDFELKGTRQSYVIERVLLDEINTFSPFGQRGFTHSVHSKFMMVLNKTEDANWVYPTNMRQLTKLTYESNEDQDFYANVNMEKEHFFSNFLDTSSASVDQVMEVYDDLVEEHKKYNAAFEGTSSDPNYQLSSTLIHKMFRLSQLVGTLSYQKLEQVYNMADDRGDAHKKVFWDLMPMIGTNPSFMFMKKLITEGDAPSSKVKEYLRTMSFHIKSPSKTLIDEYISLCKSDKVSSNQQFRRLCFLPLASLIEQHCVKPHVKAMKSSKRQDEAPATACKINTAEYYFTTLVNQYPNDLSISEKNFNIKLAGELGVQQSADYLSKFATNKDEHPSLRASAMWSIRKAGMVYPEKVKPVATQLFFDQQEPTELRLMSYYAWQLTGAGGHELEMVAKHLRVETNKQVADYIAHLIRNLASMKPHPCMRSIHKQAKLVLPTVKKYQKHYAKKDLRHMWNSYVSVDSNWSDEFNYGSGSATSIMFNDNNSTLPVNIFYKTSEVMSGIKVSPMVLHLQTHRAEKVLNRIVGPNGLLSGKESIFDVFSLKKHSKREAESSKPDRYTDVYIAATMSVYGRIVTFFDIDSTELKKMMSDDGTVKIPNIKKLIHSFNNQSNPNMMLLFEKWELTTNEMGLPLYQSINDFQFKNFKLNTIKVDIEPGFFKDERKGKPPTRLTGSIDMKFVRHNEMFIGSGALVTNEKKQIGVGFTKKKILTVPLKLSIDANLVENKVQLRREPIHENLLYIKAIPYNYIRSYDPSNEVHQKDSKWVYHFDFNNVTDMSPLKIEYMTRLNVGVKAVGKHLASSDWSLASWRKYLIEVGRFNAMFMYFYSPEGTPFEISLSTITTADNPTKEFTTTVTWNHHNKENSPPLNDVEKQLEEFTKDASGKAKTVHYHFTLTGGSSKERKLDLDFAYSRSPDYMKHKWRIFYDRPEPLEGRTTSNFSNFCYNGQAEFERGDLENLLKINADSTTNMAQEIKYEGQCDVVKMQTQRINLKALREKLAEQYNQSRAKLETY